LPLYCLVKFERISPESLVPKSVESEGFSSIVKHDLAIAENLLIEAVKFQSALDFGVQCESSQY
jgi:hypothetical protein